MKIFKFTDNNANIINLDYFINLSYKYEWGNYLVVQLICGNKIEKITLKYNNEDEIYNDYKRFIEETEFENIAK
jgi:hypothetical protein